MGENRKKTNPDTVAAIVGMSLAVIAGVSLATLGVYKYTEANGKPSALTAQEDQFNPTVIENDDQSAAKPEPTVSPTPTLPPLEPVEIREVKIPVDKETALTLKQGEAVLCAENACGYTSYTPSTAWGTLRDKNGLRTYGFIGLAPTEVQFDWNGQPTLLLTVTDEELRKPVIVDNWEALRGKQIKKGEIYICDLESSATPCVPYILGFSEGPENLPIIGIDGNSAGIIALKDGLIQ